ncbi:hypothetical protein K504DRAFT_498752 [Pleomassaria siparia CBS 279.74]|uniref:Uncharacterized protein n=1 Tax=Pleomassaria siparia CBS 279.74 TaxID=1314801 RepID=A0A6G1KN34_9PLEO|nr:hypothetical protein K504DRAFT_498752 [Pleomassaria siparia CBS 279.74]
MASTADAAAVNTSRITQLAAYPSTYQVAQGFGDLITPDERNENNSAIAVTSASSSSPLGLPRGGSKPTRYQDDQSRHGTEPSTQTLNKLWTGLTLLPYIKFVDKQLKSMSSLSEADDTVKIVSHFHSKRPAEVVSVPLARQVRHVSIGLISRVIQVLNLSACFIALDTINEEDAESSAPSSESNEDGDAEIDIEKTPMGILVSETGVQVREIVMLKTTIKCKRWKDTKNPKDIANVASAFGEEGNGIDSCNKRASPIAIGTSQV